jgi:hypothetical protein
MSLYRYPIYIPEYNIYDIFLNDENKLVIIQPYETSYPFDIKLVLNDKTIQFNHLICGDRHTYVYYAEYYQNESSNIVNLEVNGNYISTKYNTYPVLTNEILMSTILKDEDKYVKQWIEYHRKIGVHKIILYDNSDKNTLSELLKEYILNGVVILIKWKYTYRLEKSGFSAQTTQQNHSVYAFRASKYIGLLDIDEYVNPQDNYFDIDKTFDKIINQNNLNINNYSGFRLLNRFFYNPNNLDCVGYKFLNIYNCDNFKLTSHEKNFIIPKNCNIACIHIVSNGLPTYTPSTNSIYFNHYYYLNKETRGRNNTDLTDDSIKNKADLLQNL